MGSVDRGAVGHRCRVTAWRGTRRRSTKRCSSPRSGSVARAMVTDTPPGWVAVPRFHDGLPRSAAADRRHQAGGPARARPGSDSVGLRGRARILRGTLAPFAGRSTRPTRHPRPDLRQPGPHHASIDPRRDACTRQRLQHRCRWARCSTAAITDRMISLEECDLSFLMRSIVGESDRPFSFPTFGDQHAHGVGLNVDEHSLQRRAIRQRDFHGHPTPDSAARLPRRVRFDDTCGCRTPTGRRRRRLRPGPPGRRRRSNEPHGAFDPPSVERVLLFPRHRESARQIVRESRRRGRRCRCAARRGSDRAPTRGEPPTSAAVRRSRGPTNEGSRPRYAISTSRPPSVGSSSKKPATAPPTRATQNLEGGIREVPLDVLIGPHGAIRPSVRRPDAYIQSAIERRRARMFADECRAACPALSRDAGTYVPHLQVRAPGTDRHTPAATTPAAPSPRRSGASRVCSSVSR